MNNILRALRALVLIGAVTVFAGCASLQANRPAAAVENDAAVTRKVEEALFHEPFLRSAQIRVTTVDGVVKLTGVVEKALDVETASNLVSKVPGVVRVQTELGVKE